MELRHLRYFLAVVEERNFTRAAARLHIAQPAVSAQIRDLEESLGNVKLLNRSSHYVELTPAGEIFYKRAKELLENLDKTVVEIQRVHEGEKGHLSIALIGSQSHAVVPQVLREFRRKFPEVEITLEELVPTQQWDALLNDRLDIGFVGPIISKPPGKLKLECIAQEYPLLAVPGDHPLAIKNPKSVRLSDLKNESFIFTTRENSPGYRQWLDQFFQNAGFTPHVVQEVDRARTGIQYVAAGFGVSIFAEHLARLGAPGVKFIPFTPTPPKIRYGVAWRTKSNSQVIEQFLKNLRSVSASQ